ncbi:DUF262 domain-containing protein [Chitinophaga oryziterrae]|uniref:DUF262 domain-containing protein n=1 Tax=Chitinophaga oryziterrae TaxID=1031224 RepID=A0A6N8J4I1_9BACT|nr:DUF262 domain-containing protein [Chitinophaga oryziterrae]MVT40127.1 DUF262 domain-containing protein [Chitinophaga oryziterrae]
MSNHIANKIEAKDKSLGKIFINERYKIDVFQREYRWQRKHIEALISDLSISFLSAYKVGDTIEKYDSYDSYYMGPIVLCNDGGSLSIVDGQQRLTSFTLLLIYLHHLQSKLELPSNLQKDFKQFLYVTKAGKTTLVLDIDTREKIVRHLYYDPEVVFVDGNKDESVSNIIERYEDITMLFPEEISKKDILPLFIEWLLEKVVLVEVKAFSMENAYTIFETMNDRGMNLNPTEMLKGYLLSKVSDSEKSLELNEFWKERIAEIKITTNSEGDLEFFRAWLRAKYAETVRSTKQGAENEDFEIIGTQFHNWVKKNSAKTGLSKPEDYYYFLRSDFDYYSSIYQQLYRFKSINTEGLEDIYISNYYTIADSLAYPLYLSPVTKLDDEDVVVKKINIIGKFIDIYINSRTLTGKAITQSSIRYSMYELIKSIRDTNVKELQERLAVELEKSWEKIYSPFSVLHRMDNWGYYHYFFARILLAMGIEVEDFSELMRSRKQSSLVLFQIWEDDEIESDVDEITWDINIKSVAGHCLVRRFDLDIINSKNDPIKRVNYLIKQGYLPEMNDYVIANDRDEIIKFIGYRDEKLRELTNEIWSF